MTVVIPAFNEVPANLKLCVDSVMNADGNKEVIVVDDGSTDVFTKNVLVELKAQYPDLIVHTFEKNKGKRMTHDYAFRRAKGEFLVTIDSDTLVNKDALVKLIRPFSSKKVGAITGNIVVLNRSENFLTKMISARYWSAFNYERKGLSSWNIVTCCSGPLSAYRKSYVMPILKDYSEQMFLGKKCTYGDDRALTRLILRDYDVVFVQDAIARTECPSTMRVFLRQQLRWKKSWIRETYLTSKFMLKKSWLLSWEILITTILPVMGLLIRPMLFVSFFYYPVLILYYILSIIMMAIIRNTYMLVENPKEFIYSIPYAFVHEGLIFWLYPFALFGLRDTGWGTR